MSTTLETTHPSVTPSLPGAPVSSERPLAPAAIPPSTHDAAPTLVESVFDPDAGEWDAFIKCQYDGTLFHTTAWMKAVARCFQHQPHSLAARRGGRVVGVLPLLLVESRLTGRRLISMPYAVAGGPLFADETARKSLEEGLRALQAALDVEQAEIRSEHARFRDAAALEGYVKFERALPATEADVLTSVPRKARAVIRHAMERERLIITEGAAQLPLMWRLYALNMRRLGSPAYPMRFLKALLAEMRSGDDLGGVEHRAYRTIAQDGSCPAAGHRITVAWRRGRPVAGLVSFAFKDRLLPYFYGCRPEARECGAAHYLYYDLMRWGVARGFALFDFGRSRVTNRGACEFKRLMGFEPRPLGYQLVMRDAQAPKRPLRPDDRRIALAQHVWRRLPLGVTTYLSGKLAKHFPG